MHQAGAELNPEKLHQVGGEFPAQYYTSVENNFDKTMAFIAKNNMLEFFKPRLKQCVEWASPCGWGFADSIADIYYEHFPDDD